MRHGLLLIDKPIGPTSHDIVAAVRRILHESKVGHSGTLDPLASGLLPLFVGAKALKVVELFKDLPKVYEARVRFGRVSATYDREGPIEDVEVRPGWSPPTQRELQRVLEQHFLGPIEQVPPAHSAVHIDGKRAYERVRTGGLLPPLPARQVTIGKLRLVSYAYPDACVRITCSAGTYIRSLAHDLGQVLRCGAYLERLRRLQVGSWKIENACTLEVSGIRYQVSDKPQTSTLPHGSEQAPRSVTPRAVSWARVIPLKDILSSFPRLDLTEGEHDEIQYGRSIYRLITEEPTIGWFEELPVVMLERDAKHAEKAHPRKVF